MNSNENPNLHKIIVFVQISIVRRFHGRQCQLVVELLPGCTYSL